MLFFFSSRRRHTRLTCDWSSDVCSSDLFADAGKYAELLTYLEQRSKDELEESALLTLLLGIAHSRLGRLEVGQQWAMVAQLRARSRSEERRVGKEWRGGWSREQ